MAAVTEAPARTPLAYGSDNSSGGVAIAAEQAPDHFQVLSVAQLIFRPHDISARACSCSLIFADLNR
jgi:hypothetical protein